MSSKIEYYGTPGDRVTPAMLKTPKGISLCAFLQQAGAVAFAELVSCHRTTDPASDTVVVRIKVERPQRCVNPIRREEMVALQFWDSDETFPEVLALRKDFPLVPHVNLKKAEFPRSLCLYDEPYEQVKHGWTPARFIVRLRMWLEKTATGTLHGEDQPLEPLLIGGRARLVLPSDFLDVQAKCDQVFEIHCQESDNDDLTLIANWQNTAQKNVKYAAVVLVTKEMQHGVIRSQPENLHQLHEFCGEAGLDLQQALSDKLKNWFLDKPYPSILNCKFVVVLFLPKRRSEGGIAESMEKWAFLSLKSIKEVGIALGVCGTEGGKTGLVIGTAKRNDAKLKDIPIGALQVISMPSSKTAASMSDQRYDDHHLVAIGAGALGSQVLMNLVRSGYGKWTVVDDDTLLPHNLCRHALSSWAIGLNKAVAVARLANDTIVPGKDCPPVVTPVTANVLSPGKYEQQLVAAYDRAQTIVDLSASISVSRFLSDANRKTRNVSVFITPPGSSLVVLAEDKERNFRLDWLEMLHYRAVLNEPSLSSTLKGDNQRVRYGNSCRDLSSKLSQDSVAYWSAQASHSIKTLSDDGAMIQIFSKTEGEDTRRISAKIHPIFHTRLNEWLIRFDDWVVTRMAELRVSKLPNETGGILLGNFDTERKICSIVDLLPAPSDSQEWPTSYIRGCEGLREKVLSVEASTVGQISYAGEWHSHPKGAAVSPSTDDWSAYGWLVAQMAIEGLPGLMMIIGDGNRYCFVGGEPSRGQKLSSKRKR